MTPLEAPAHPRKGAARGLVRARTPLRISFAGGGTDVPPFPETEGGAVLSATIDRYVLGSLSVHAHSHVSIESRDYGISLELAPRGRVLSWTATSTW